MVLAKDFEDVTEVNEKENYIVLFKHGKHVIKMKITDSKPPYGFDERYGNKIPTEIPENISNDMKLRLQNKLFTKENIAKGKLECARYFPEKTTYSIDLSKFKACETNPDIDTLIEWLKQRKDEFTAMCLTYLKLKKEGKDVNEVVEAIKQHPHKYTRTFHNFGEITEKTVTFTGNGKIRTFDLPERHVDSISRVVVDNIVQVIGYDYHITVDNSKVIFNKAPPENSDIKITYVTKL